jgi:signal peptidase II
MDLIAFACLFLLLDQWSKSMVRAHVGHASVACGSLLRVRYVAHTNESYRRGSHRAALMLIWLSALVSAIVLYRSGFWFQGHVARFGIALALGGALGNLLDVLRFHHVVDFIDLGWWPVFNLADVAIVAGLPMALWPTH